MTVSLVRHCVVQSLLADLAEFGNYIGADLDSDDDELDLGENSAAGPSTVPVAAPSGAASNGGFAPLEGLEEDEDDDMEGDDMQMTLHGVDGEL
jgi:hypothetical protein